MANLTMSPDARFLLAQERDNFTLRPVGWMLWDTSSGAAGPFDMGKMRPIGSGRDASHLLLVTQEGETVTVWRLE